MFTISSLNRIPETKEAEHFPFRKKSHEFMARKRKTARLPDRKKEEDFSTAVAQLTHPASSKTML